MLTPLYKALTMIMLDAMCIIYLGTQQPYALSEGGKRTEGI